MPKTIVAHLQLLVFHITEIWNQERTHQSCLTTFYKRTLKKGFLDTEPGCYAVNDRKNKKKKEIKKYIVLKMWKQIAIKTGSDESDITVSYSLYKYSTFLIMRFHCRHFQFLSQSTVIIFRTIYDRNLHVDSQLHYNLSICWRLSQRGVRARVAATAAHQCSWVCAHIYSLFHSFTKLSTSWFADLNRF